MKIISIRCSAGTTIPHPHESYSNIKLFVELTGELKANDTPADATRELQEAVAHLLSAERTRRLDAIEREYQEKQAKEREAREKQEAIWEAERKIRDAQQELKQLKNGPTDDEIPF